MYIGSHGMMVKPAPAATLTGGSSKRSLLLLAPAASRYIAGALPVGGARDDGKATVPALVGTPEQMKAGSLIA